MSDNLIYPGRLNFMGAPDLSDFNAALGLDSQFSNRYNDGWCDRQQFIAQGVRYEHGPNFAMNAYQPIYSVSDAVESAETRPVRFWLRWLWQMLVRGVLG
jgi:hypothetical protein